MAKNLSNIKEHVVNLLFICGCSYIALLLLLLYKSKKIAAFVVPMVNGKPSYGDLDIDNWLGAFDNIVYIMMGIVLAAVLVRYLIESIAVTHEKTVLRSMIITLVVFVLEVACIIFFMKIKAPILEGDTGIILMYSLSTTALFYVLMVAFVPSCIRYLLFPRNILVK